MRLVKGNRQGSQSLFICESVRGARPLIGDSAAQGARRSLFAAAKHDLGRTITRVWHKRQQRGRFTDRARS